jgi:RNA polymerase sigma-70 factor (ECF subfamily)
MPSPSPTADARPDDPTQRLAAVERLYAEHHGFVWRVAGRFGIEIDERQDLVQDVFLVVYHALDRYEQRGAMTSWLFGITRGLARNRVRLRERRRRSLHALPPPEPSHTRATDDVEAAQILERFLVSLPPRHRVAFELAEIEGLTGPEIREATGWKLNTVYTRLRAARQAFDAFTRAHLQEGSDG